MESQPQNPEFRNNPENFHPCFEHPKNMSFLMEKKTFQFCTLKYLLILMNGQFIFWTEPHDNRDSSKSPSYESILIWVHNVCNTSGRQKS